jgi:hypothetical protein
MMTGHALHAPGEMVCLPDGRGCVAEGAIAGSGDLTMEEVVASSAMDLDSGLSVVTEQREGLVASVACNHFLNAECRSGWFHIEPGGSSLSFWFADTPRTHGETRCMCCVVSFYVGVKFHHARLNIINI